MLRIEDIVSRIKNITKSVTSDDFVTDRYIWSLVKKHSTPIIMKYANDISIVESQELYLDIPFLELEDISKIDTCEIDLGSGFCEEFIIKRSVRTIPNVRSIYGRYLMNVYSIDKSIKFQQTTFAKASNIFKSKYSRFYPDVFYVFSGGYVYVLNKDIPAISVEASLEEPYMLFSECSENNCKKAQELNACIPVQLLSEIEGMVLNDILTSIKILVGNDAGDDKKSIYRDK